MKRGQWTKRTTKLDHKEEEKEVNPENSEAISETPQ